MFSAIGKDGEELAVKFLVANGYRILARNFRCKFGELDIVAIDGDVLVFIEVKARSSQLFGSPEESITRSKLEKIRKTAMVFSSRKFNLPKKMRIDLVAIDIYREGQKYNVRIVKNIA